MISAISYSQEAGIGIESNGLDTPIYTIAERMPEPKGGMEAFYKAIANNMLYPEEAQSKGIEGKVFVRFVVTATGKIRSVEVLKGVNPALDQEAVRLIKLSEEKPGWTPGQEQWEQVNVQIVQQITFKLKAAFKEKLKKTAQLAVVEQDTAKTGDGIGEHDSLMTDLYSRADVMPAPKKGWEVFYKIMQENYMYPEKAVSKKTRGVVYLKFIVDDQGEMKGLSVRKGLHIILDEEALRLLSQVSQEIDWYPGTRKGKAVNVQLTLPVYYELDHSNKPVYIQSTPVFSDTYEREWAYENLPVAENINGVKIYHKPEIYPEPKGGFSELNQFFQENLKYPEEALNDQAAGQVLVRMIVTPDGYGYDEKIEQSIHPALDAEALRLIKLFNQDKKWTAGMNMIKRVSAYVLVPVNFFITGVPNITLYHLDSLMAIPNLLEFPETEAQPVGGMKAFYQLIFENLEYPREAIINSSGGSTYVRFIIDENGEPTYVHSVEGRVIGYGMDQEAVRVVRLSKWVPAMHQGKPVKQMKVIPIKYVVER
ncbi:TonB family protein [Flammeovirgaceae bacterium 311]|nr:TonB family protein [Flammeovirgaceae bacterium 311]